MAEQQTLDDQYKSLIGRFGRGAEVYDRNPFFPLRGAVSTFGVAACRTQPSLALGLVSRNVASLAEAPRVQRYEVTPLTPEQAQVFLKAAESDRLAGLFTLALEVRPETDSRS